ncbi:hypothetical protein DQ04_05661030 [Trypanosoma grayi]|uniref:hypothetical protein n=1 Tax=Trypanosoma grayi TaxID=71804 RepID=UPI0004F494E3|nr:hypothetical protein DQ04_05661030 [Trypanosoma grayi]KEG09181.1 hypothetical protein DQ04_05661030 [Trypanosoma grayi]
MFAPPRLGRCVAATCVALAITATPVLAAEAPDVMNGIGMPILFIVMIMLMLVVSRARLLEAYRVSRNDTATCICFVVALINMLISVFLYFSTAYNYGLVTTVLAYCMAFLTENGSYGLNAKWLLAVYLVWFLFLLGFPSAWGPGIIIATNNNSCVAFYSTFASTMCNDGWLTFIKFVACIVVSLTLLSVLLIIAVVMGVEDDLLEAPLLGDAEGVRGAMDTETTKGNASQETYRRI